MDKIHKSFCRALVTVVFVSTAVAISQESGDVEITEDLFYQPGNFFDANAEAGTGAKLWPDRTAIPYSISSDFGKSHQDLILKALRIMEKKTNDCISFKARTTEFDYIYFRPSYFGDCASALGQQGSYQTIHLAVPGLFSSASCMYIGRIQHEVMHALGFDHEQKRPDRDQYIDVNSANIGYDEYRRDFAINKTMYTFGTKYDYHSILHYYAFQASENITRPSMVPKKGLIVRMGQAVRMSPTDVAKIMIAYKCPFTVAPAIKKTASGDDFPNFSLEPMTADECGAQFNRYCQSDLTTKDNCTDRRDYRIVCRSNASVAVLERMTMDMAEPPLRLASISVEEELIAKYSFTPIQRHVLKLQLWNCTTDRVTSRLLKLNFTNLLHLEVSSCYNLVVEKADFTISQQLRMILLYNSTIKSLQHGAFTDLPQLQILSLEAFSDDQKNYKFESGYRNYLRNLHCGCEFAWYRSWWRANRKLRIKVEVGELYSFEGPISGTFFSSDELNREDLYHPINCTADPFPLSTEWITYYTQTDYSVNEPICNASLHSVMRPATVNAAMSTTKLPLQRHIPMNFTSGIRFVTPSLRAAKDDATENSTSTKNEITYIDQRDAGSVEK